MSKPDTPYRKRALGDRALSPETLMMSYGFDAKMSEGSIKPPVFLTSTFAFATVFASIPRLSPLLSPLHAIWTKAWGCGWT